MKHELIDIWRSKNPDKIELTWSCRTDLRNSAARLDRFYVSDFIVNHVSEVEILKAFRSDHSPIKLLIQLPNKMSIQSPHWCLNTDILSETAYVSEVRDFWRSW